VNDVLVVVSIVLVFWTITLVVRYFGGDSLPREIGMDKGRLQVALAAAEAERDALLPIKESWSQLKRELDEVRADRDSLEQTKLNLSDALFAMTAERDRYRNALRKIADSGCSLALGGGKPTCRESMPDPRDSWDWCTRCVAAHALAALTEPEET
jgi:hypothetical protein